MRGSIPSHLLRVLPEVKSALSMGKPVVALESTILAHGLPYPQNIELAQELSHIIRQKGVIPATVAIKDGAMCVGLTKDEISDLAIAGPEKRAWKCSSRDLSVVLARQQFQSNEKQYQWGATTVASTMIGAHYAGISTFVTGGAGGVHRGGEVTMDVSADLVELSKTPVVVVSAGVKSILDIKRTLEVLETFGVPVIAYGTDDFPAFFSPTSGVPTPCRIDDPREIAKAYHISRSLGMTNGMLVAVPNDDPAGAAVEKAIQEALQEADALGIEGKDVTPFILSTVAEKTDGDSLQSNIGLVKRNAEVGSDIAISIAEEQRNKNDYSNSYYGSHNIPKEQRSSRVLVMGGAVVDLVARPEKGGDLIIGTSNPGHCLESDGGVGRNIAEVLGRLNTQVKFYSSVGDDTRGTALLERINDIMGTQSNICIIEGANTATYLALLDSDGDLHTAVADMKVLSDIPIPSEETLSQTEIMVLDANPPVAQLMKAAKRAHRAGVRILFEPTSVPKAALIGLEDDFLSCLTWMTPNVDELFSMCSMDVEDAFKNDFEPIKIGASKLLEKMRSNSHIIITMGAKGAFLATKSSNEVLQYQYFPVGDNYSSTESTNEQNSTGAGDTLAGAFVKAILDGYETPIALKAGMDAALKSVNCVDRAISPDL